MTTELLEKFKQNFPIPKGKNENPYIILFDAYTGMGKSTVARVLIKYLEAIVLNNDEVVMYEEDGKEFWKRGWQTQPYVL